MRSAYLTAVLVLAPALASAQQPCTADADSVVDSVYRQVLERPAGGEGNARAEQLRNGQTTVREIVREVARSPEHAQRFLPANNRTQAVTNLYRHLLGRAPDSSGLNDHVRGRDSLVALVDTFVNSDEYVRQFGDDVVPGGNRRYCREGSGPAANNNYYGRTRFQNLDRNGNGVIERDEWNGSRQSFDAQDWNHDGVLSGEEIRGGGRRGAREAEANFDPTAPSTWTEETFHQLDRNRDGRLTSSEWFYNADYFRRADRNRDGALTLNEFVNASSNDDRGRYDDNRNRYDYNSFTSLDANRNGSLSYNEWRWTRSSFDRYDTNRDGVISRQEFDAAGGAPESR